MSSEFVLDVGDGDFESEVVARSARTPVVVDFWAPWCGPCRSLGPVLEGLAEEYAGAFVLARVNVDAAPRVAGQLGVRSIPTVVGFRDGRRAAEFVGAQPEPTVRQFLTAILPSEADQLASQGDERLAAGEGPEAEQLFRAALEADTHHPRALLGLARVLGTGGDTESALELLERVTGTPALETEAGHLAAELRTREGSDDEAALRARLANDPDDLEARLALGRALAAARRFEEALTELLEVVIQDRSFADEGARKTMIDVFELLGSEDPLTERFRGELARALFC